MTRVLLISLIALSGCFLLHPVEGNPSTKDDTTPDTGESAGDTDNDQGSDEDTGDPGEDTEGPDWVWTPVLIDFDELSAQIDVSTVYPEVTFSTDDSTRLYSWDYPIYARSEPYTAYTANSPGGAGVPSELTFTFTEPVRALEFYTLADQTNGPFAVVDVFTESGATGTVDLVGDAGSGTAERCDLSAWEHITSITIRDMRDPGSVNYDDIYFEQRGL